jgi:hypothetical protein
MMCNLISLLYSVMFNVTVQEGYRFVLFQYHTIQSHDRASL